MVNASMEKRMPQWNRGWLSIRSKEEQRSVRWSMEQRMRRELKRRTRIGEEWLRPPRAAEEPRSVCLCRLSPLPSLSLSLSNEGPAERRPRGKKAHAELYPHAPSLSRAQSSFPARCPSPFPAHRGDSARRAAFASSTRRDKGRLLPPWRRLTVQGGRLTPPAMATATLCFKNRPDA